MEQYLLKSTAGNFSLFLWGSLVILVVTSRNQLWNCTHFGILPMNSNDIQGFLQKKKNSLSSLPFELSLFSRIIWLHPPIPSTKQTVNGKRHLIRLFRLKREPSYFLMVNPLDFMWGIYLFIRREGMRAFFVLLGFDCFFLLVLFFVLFSASYVCWGFRALTNRIIDWFHNHCFTSAIFFLRPRRIKIFRIQTYKRRYTSQ